nr:pentatricopeptide repeat-containing protein At2g17140 [Ipomoea batatas]
MGNKREFDELADHMIEMVSTGMVSFIYPLPLFVLFALNGCCILLFQNSIVQKDDGGAIAMRSLKRVLNGWSFQAQKDEILDNWCWWKLKVSIFETIVSFDWQV